MNGRRALKAAEVEPNYVPVEWQLVKQKADNVVAKRLKNKIATQTHVPRVLYHITYYISTKCQNIIQFTEQHNGSFSDVISLFQLCAIALPHWMELAIGIIR